MNRSRTILVAFASTFALGSYALAGVSTAYADHSSDAPCATQQVHADKATAKLAALTAKYAAHPTKKVKKAKKAQVQRLAHATARLDKCLAAQPV